MPITPRLDGCQAFSLRFPFTLTINVVNIHNLALLLNSILAINSLLTMTQYDPTYPSSTPRSAPNDNGDGLLPPSGIERPDDRAQSLSGSDDGSSGIHKTETEIEGSCPCIFICYLLGSLPLNRGCLLDLANPQCGRHTQTPHERVYDIRSTKAASSISRESVYAHGRNQ